jgi:hypothetical protein
MTQGIKFAGVVILGALLTTGASASQDAFDHHHDNDTFTLTTPPLVPDGNSELDCSIGNIGRTGRDVTIEALDRTGRVVASWEGALAPGAGAMAIAKAAAAPRSCRFVVEGQIADFRAVGLVVVPGIGPLSALAAQ